MYAYQVPTLKQHVRIRTHSFIFSTLHRCVQQNIVCVGTEEMYWLIAAYGKNVEKKAIINRLRNIRTKECIQDDANS